MNHRPQRLGAPIHALDMRDAAPRFSCTLEDLCR
jgi:hypothetical protein